MELSIIIVNWKSSHYLERCISSVLFHTRNLAYEIIVIDSASFDGSEQMVRDSFPGVRFIQSNVNLGFARSNNVAFKASRGRFLLFLNPDTEVLGPSINIMLERLRSMPNAGSVGCKLLNSDSTTQTSCIQAMPTIINQLLDSEFLRAKWPRCALWGTAALWENNGQPMRVDAISGACVMLKREVFEQIDMFTEDYFMYGEDVDLSYKIMKSGYENFFIPDAAVIHHGGTSSQSAASQFATIMMRESIWRFLSKTRGRFYGLGYRLAMLTAAVTRIGMLVALWPVRHPQHREAILRRSIQKWMAVFRWSLQRERMLGS